MLESPKPGGRAGPLFQADACVCVQTSGLRISQCHQGAEGVPVHVHLDHRLAQLPGQLNDSRRLLEDRLPVQV